MVDKFDKANEEFGISQISKENGKIYPVPYHGAKELGKGLEMKMRREMGIK
jgi:hypothetical protein